MKNFFLFSVFLSIGSVLAADLATNVQKASAANAVTAAAAAQQTGMHFRPSWCPGGACQGCVNSYCPSAGQYCLGGNCNTCIYNNGVYYCPTSASGGQCPNGNCNGCIQTNGQTYCPNYNINGINGINNGINGLGNCPNGNCNGCIQGNGITYCPISMYGNQCPNGNCNGCVNQNGQEYCPINNYNGINGINGVNGINSGSCINTNGQYYCPTFNGQCPNGNCAGCINTNGQEYCPSGSSINGITNGIVGINGISNINGINGINGLLPANLPSGFVYGQTSLYVDPTGTYTFYFTPTSTSASCSTANNGQTTYRQCVSYFFGSNGAATTITGFTGAPTTFTYTETSTQVFYNVQSQCFNNGGIQVNLSNGEDSQKSASLTINRVVLLSLSRLHRLLPL